MNNTTPEVGITRSVTREDLYRLALDVPILHACIRHHENGLATWDDAVLAAAYLLGKENLRLTGEVVCLLNLSVSPTLSGRE